MAASYTDNRQGKTVKLRKATLDRINALKHKGQSYDGVITELLDLHDSQAAEGKGPQSSRAGKE
jgi:hypothetical protein